MSHSFAGQFYANPIFSPSDSDHQLKMEMQAAEDSAREAVEAANVAVRLAMQQVAATDSDNDTVPFDDGSAVFTPPQPCHHRQALIAAEEQVATLHQQVATLHQTNRELAQRVFNVNNAKRHALVLINQQQEEIVELVARNLDKVNAVLALKAHVDAELLHQNEESADLNTRLAESFIENVELQARLDAAQVELDTLNPRFAALTKLMETTKDEHKECHVQFQWESDQLKSLVATHRKSFNNAAADLANIQADTKAASRKRRRDE